MIGLSHAVFGAGMTSLILQTADPNLLFMGAVCSLLPDIDISTSTFGQILPWVSRWLERRFSHRSCTHSLVASAVVALVTYPFAIIGYLSWDNAHTINIGYFGGYILDSCTKSGIELFWPNPIRFVVPGNRNLRLQTGSQGEYSILVLLTFLTFSIISINQHGGMEIQLNRMLATPEGVHELFMQHGDSNLIIAHIKGMRFDSTKINDDFWIINDNNSNFIVQGKDGEVYKAGTGSDVSLTVDSITADVGPPATTHVENIQLLEDQVSTKLQQFSRSDTHVYISGELKVEDADELPIGPKSDQFKTMKKSGESVLLDYAPLPLVRQKIGGQFATGNLMIRSIYEAPTAASY